METTRFFPQKEEVNKIKVSHTKTQLDKKNLKNEGHHCRTSLSCPSMGVPTRGWLDIDTFGDGLSHIDDWEESGCCVHSDSKLVAKAL